MRSPLVATALALAASIGCTDPEDRTCTTIDNICYSAEAQACRAQAPTIATGAYGCAIFVDDGGVFPAHPATALRVELFARPGDAPVVVAVSDEDGFYQAAPAPGTYQFCMPSDPFFCSAPIVLAENQPVAVDQLVTSLFTWQVR